MGPVDANVIESALFGHLEAAVSEGALTPWRLPADLRRHASASLTLMAEFSSGVRLRLRTNGDRFVIDASIVRLAMRHIGRPEAPARLVAVDGDREIVVEIHHTGVVVETSDRQFERGPAVVSRIEFDLAPGGIERDVEVWLPHDAGITLHRFTASIGGRPARVAPMAASALPRWVHHGSSISHGGSASLPTRTWPVLAARELAADVVNLGFGGNAMLDPSTARAIARTEADIITLKLGVNIVGADAMRGRTFVPAVHGFLDLIREGQPRTPIVVISAIGSAALESSPGPLRPGEDGRVAATPRDVVAGDGTLTLEVTRALLAEVIEDRRQEDSAVFYLDGTRLLGPDEGARLPDGLHPDDEGYALMADRFSALATEPSEALARAFAEARRTAQSAGSGVSAD